ncbi:MAG TPA: 6-phosphogluconolactonase [Conexibacter sp.]|nr:6-phosphogluconolactonase [Conexibacter sp.]
MITITVTDDAEAAARTCAERISEAIDEARAARGVAHVALAGGRTPGRTYELLGERVDDWRDVHLWFGDERCVPLDDPDSNHRLVTETLVAPLAARGVAPPEVHAVTGADGDPATAAADYERELRATVPGDPPVLDVALLGLGEDGHTASLFPDDPALDEHERLCVALHGTKPPFERVSLTLPVLRAARRTVVLTAGAGKAWAVGAMLAGPSNRVPASLLDGGGAVELIADRAAAPA